VESLCSVFEKENNLEEILSEFDYQTIMNQNVPPLSQKKKNIIMKEIVLQTEKKKKLRTFIYISRQFLR